MNNLPLTDHWQATEKWDRVDVFFLYLPSFGMLGKFHRDVFPLPDSPL